MLQVTWWTEELPADAQPPAIGIERAVHLTINREGKRAGEIVANLATGNWSYWLAGSGGNR